MPYTLHTQAAGEQELTSERNIITLKDSIRSTVHSVLYRKMPLLMSNSISGQAKSMQNDFPYNIGILNTMSARNIIEGRQHLDYNTMSLNMGA